MIDRAAVEGDALDPAGEAEQSEFGAQRLGIGIALERAGLDDIAASGGGASVSISTSASRNSVGN
ncbi:hypothetical protein [Marichromatium gracile]|uniref:hypothetical protein n=1 Tax=Marichromatium gracile TaxID=1048 RepID=UPI001F5BDD8A|nr:hypothetical protein [Marichromatium gracile]